MFFFVNVAFDSSKAANAYKEEGIVLIFVNTFLAPKEDMLINAPVYDQYEEEEDKEEEEEEEMCDSVLIIEDNKGGECIQEPVYDEYVEEDADAHIEEEEDLSLVTNILQVPKKEMEDDEWLRRSSYEDMVSQEVFNNLE